MKKRKHHYAYFLSKEGLIFSRERHEEENVEMKEAMKA